MSTVRMPPILRQAVGGAREVDANGATVRELLDDLTTRYPGIRAHLLDDGGELNRFVNVYVNNEDVRLGEGLETSVAPDATVIVLPAMAGGCEMIDLASPCGLSGFLSQPPDSSRNDDRSHLQACGDAGSII